MHGEKYAKKNRNVKRNEIIKEGHNERIKLNRQSEGKEDVE